MTACLPWHAVTGMIRFSLGGWSKDMRNAAREQNLPIFSKGHLATRSISIGKIFFSAENGQHLRNAGRKIYIFGQSSSLLHENFMRYRFSRSQRASFRVERLRHYLSLRGTVHV
jgi:hypothetical protein